MDYENLIQFVGRKREKDTNDYYYKNVLLVNPIVSIRNVRMILWLLGWFSGFFRSGTGCISI